ncbi:PQQ-binding-like beta-propeller repeat protein [Flavihumibacter fluvii]|uniref:outer membrane protein assembly factor BamB family protein n=1 Tax=Flavihumibacter fluvii TaxID=2838157 RepID=UPI001EFA5887|nr:PQQ-binding-like beta-propeller repeat protein [Flavihumibacter fluvii]ULQ54706.1 PQQ-binding-like beta-propeller repeat protein [Flavihumibacter fluvii]
MLLLIVNSSCSPRKEYNNWNITGGTKENIRYSTLAQIDTANVQDLEVAWVYRSEGGDTTRFGPMQCNPIIVNNVLYGVSPKLNLFALDAASGKRLWNFDPADSINNKAWHRNSVNMNRGVAYWEEGEDKRIIYTAGRVAFAINALTGKLIPSFGKDGGIDLHDGLGRDSSKVFVAPTSPVMIYRNLFILSGLVGDETPGDIRAFDVKTGKQQWSFHTIPYPGEAGYETWEDTSAYRYLGSTNSWGGFSLDEQRGILYAPTGNPTHDFYGGQRLGKGLYGNCLLALDAATGKLIWHFQTVHHDVWDMDIPTPPALVTVTRNGKKIDAVAQTTKTGFIFLFDRENGKPLFPIEERPVLTNTSLVKEKLWPTQPFPVLPKPFARQTMTVNDLNNITTNDSTFKALQTQFRTYRSGAMFTPPSIEGTVILPGFDGGGEWGGPSVDPETNILYVNANEMAWVLNMVENKPADQTNRTNLEAGVSLYSQYCMGCHGPERLGGGDYPAILGVEKKYSKNQFTELLTTGRRMMPGFNNLSKAEKDAIASFILNITVDQKKKYTGPVTREDGPPPSLYGFTGYNKFLTKDGYPAISPPWGTINAIDLNTGEYVWKVPFSEYEELKKKGIPVTGRENYGGPVVTAGGVLFIAATADAKFRAYNKRTGKLLLETDLPAPGLATPSVYMANGKQYVVIACGGTKWDDRTWNDSYVAFALPKVKE